MKASSSLSSATAIDPAHFVPICNHERKHRRHCLLWLIPLFSEQCRYLSKGMRTGMASFATDRTPSHEPFSNKTMFFRFRHHHFMAEVALCVVWPLFLAHSFFMKGQTRSQRLLHGHPYPRLVGLGTLGRGPWTRPR